MERPKHVPRLLRGKYTSAVAIQSVHRSSTVDTALV